MTALSTLISLLYDPLSSPTGMKQLRLIKESIKKSEYHTSLHDVLHKYVNNNLFYSLYKQFYYDILKEYYDLKQVSVATY